MSVPANYSYLEVPSQLIDFVKNKKKSSESYFRYLLARTSKMFQYTGLPATIDHFVFERMVQVNGIACITKGPDENLYCFGGSLGGKQDVYYRPTQFIIANPHIGAGDGFTKEVTVLGEKEHDGVLMRNDSEWIGLTPLIGRYAVLMAENVLTVRSADIMLRILALLSAPNDRVRKSAEDYLKKLEKGELGVIGDSAFSDGIKMQSPPSNNGSYLTQFIELQQYYKGSFFGELGLRANYNMKREAIGQGESSLDEDAILPLCDNMLTCRQQDMQLVNDMFGTSIKVEFSSAWLQNRLEYSITMASQLASLGDSVVEMKGDDSNEKKSENGAVNDAGGSIDEQREEPSGEAAGDHEKGGVFGASVEWKKDSSEKAESKDGAGIDDVLNPESVNDIHGNEVMDVLKEIVDESIASRLAQEKDGDENGNVDEISTEVEDTPADD